MGEEKSLGRLHSRRPKGNPIAKSLSSQHLRKQVVPSKKAYNRNKVNKENKHDQDQDI
jgi:hypothetical protein